MLRTSERYLAPIVFCLALLLPGVSRAACNIIPPAVPTFRGTLGSTDRPFARPGDWVKVTLDIACHGASPGFTGATGDYVVSVTFKPPGTSERYMMVLSEDCSAITTNDCGLNPPVACIEVNGVGQDAGLEKVDIRTFRFRFPDSDTVLRVCGDTLCIPPSECSDPLECLLGANDDLTWTGPSAIAITPLGQPLPCGLATQPCTGQAGLTACIDGLFADDNTCSSEPDPTFSHFVGLPPPNNYQGLCTDPVPPCTGTVDDLRMTIDAEGNLLIPMDWRGILVDRDEVPIARLLRATSRIEAFEGRGVPIRIQDFDSLKSYSPEGVVLPPLFDPQQDPSSSNLATFFGTADAPTTVLRIARHRQPSPQCTGGANDDLPCGGPADCPAGACGPPRCFGGGNDGGTCSDNTDCPDGECGPGRFDFSTRLAHGVGPIVVRLGACIGGSNSLATCMDDIDCPGGQCGDFSLAALDPVPLDGLSQSDLTSIFVMEEAIPNPPQDLNGDGDTVDHVIKLADRNTGSIQSIGEASSEGRAIARIQVPPFSFPAVAVEGDLVAFLEPEALQGGVDTNANNSVFETILKVYRLGGGELTDPLQPLSADAAPVIEERSLAISNGSVFFRTSEAARADQTTELVTENEFGEPSNAYAASPVITPDGRYVAFWGNADDLGPSNPNSENQVYLRDRLTEQTEMVSVSSSGTRGNAQSARPSISADGRYVAFESRADNLVLNDNNNFCEISHNASCQDIFVRDRVLGTTTRVNVDSMGNEANNFSQCGSISADGRYVAFDSRASNLVPNDTNDVCPDDFYGNDNCFDVFVHDRVTGVTSLVSVDSNGTQGNADTFGNPVLSADGRYVAFESAASNLVANDTNGFSDIFVHDRATGETTRVNVTSEGEEANGFTETFSMSADGRFVAFNSRATNLVPGDTNGESDVFVHDRRTGETTRVSVDSVGGQLNSFATLPSISPDGRFVAFPSAATNLFMNDSNGTWDAFVHDRVTGLAKIASLDASHVQFSDTTLEVAVSAQGAFVAFTNQANTLGQQIFVRGPDSSSGDLTGDGSADDVVLQVMDTSVDPPPITTLCPATIVAVSNGRAAFLRPERAGQTPSLGLCPVSSSLVGDLPVLNADGDALDEVVHLWNGTTVQNLGRAARGIALSDLWLAALVSEADQGGTNFNGDGDADDTVLQLYPVGGGGWVNPGHAADAIDIVGSLAAFITPEAMQGDMDLNGDGDTDDRVIRTYDADSSQLANIGQAAEEFVLGESGLLAFRTLEQAQGGQPLNGDGDVDDGVLQIYDPSAGLLNTGQAVTPCYLEACDPRVPYKVKKDTVTFLTLEADQGHDLNGDGDLDDVVLQILNARQACHNGTPAGACHMLAAASAGICTDTAKACANDESCPAGLCFLPPGGCVEDLGSACTPPAFASSPDPCPGDQFCAPIPGNPGNGTCQIVRGVCRTDKECEALPACSNPGQCTCNDDTTKDFQRLADPLGEDDGTVFTGTGRCVEDRGSSCGASSDCQTGEFCEEGSCRLEQGVCSKDEDCPPGSTCEQDLLISTAADSDGDELPDVVDNCPNDSNILQEDDDQDGIGNACDPVLDPLPVTICSKPDVPIPDPGGVTDQLLLTEGDVITDVDVALDISHTWVGDLLVTLTHIDTGTTVTLVDRPGVPASGFGCQSDDVQATLDDDVNSPVENECAPDPPAIRGTLVPNEPLAGFVGESSTGTWTLAVFDLASGDTGTLNEWCLSIRSPVTNSVAGRVAYYSGDRPVPGATVQVLPAGGGGGSASSAINVQSDSSGNYSAEGLSSPAVLIQPVKDGDAGTGVSALDASYVLQDAVGLRVFDEFQSLACDVTGNGSISAFDASHILQFAVGLIDEFPVSAACGSDWAFVPMPGAGAATPIQPQIGSGACQPGGIEISSLQGQTTEQNFTAVLFGDCTGNWQPAVPAARAAAARVSGAPKVYAGTARKRGRRWIRVPLYVESSAVHALDFEFEYDASAMQLRRVRRGRGARGALVAHSEHRPGSVKVALAGARPIDASEPVLVLDFIGRGHRLRLPDLRPRSISSGE